MGQLCFFGGVDMASSFLGGLSDTPQRAADVQIYSKISGPPRLNRRFLRKDHNRPAAAMEGPDAAENGIPAAEDDRQI